MKAKWVGMPKRIDVEGLFDAVVSVFAERGYAAATTQEIAARAGVNEVTLFRRYGTKAALVSAALTHKLSSSPFATLHASDDVSADLLAIATAYDETNRIWGGAVMTLIAEIPRHPELRVAVADLQPNLLNASSIIAAHQARGAIGPGNPFQLLGALLAPLLAAGMWARANSEPVLPGFAPAPVVDAFLYGHSSGARPGEHS